MCGQRRVTTIARVVAPGIAVLTNQKMKRRNKLLPCPASAGPSLSRRKRSRPAEIVLRTHSFHHNRRGQNEDDLEQRPSCKNFSKQRHVMPTF